MVRKAGLLCALIGGAWVAGGTPALAADAASVIETYADIAHAKYEDALTTAVALEKAIDTLIAKPTDANLKAARQAWLASRPPYQQTEGYRFGNFKPSPDTIAVLRKVMLAAGASIAIEPGVKGR